MAKVNTESLSKRLIDRLNLFFSETKYSLDMLQEELDNGDVFYKPGDVLPFLQTALMDEKFVEVEMSGITQIYFTKIHDHPPALDEEEEQQEEYQLGDYLKNMSHLITLPLEPGMGNYSIRYAERIVLRFFTSAYAVELGTFYQNQEVIEELPVL